MRLLLVLLLTSPVAAACGSDAKETPAELVGVIVDVQNEPGGGIESFTLEAGGESHTIHIAPDVDYGFPLAHLYEHQTSNAPVRCVLEEREERLYALEIVDVPVS